MRLIHVARKPLEKGLSITENVLKHSTGALNIDKTRIPWPDGQKPEPTLNVRSNGLPGDDRTKSGQGQFAPGKISFIEAHDGGRWPANLILSEPIPEAPTLFKIVKA